MSLTQNQKDLLVRIFDDITISPKCSNILRNAIIGWENTIPAKGHYGINFEKNGYCLINKQTCMLGAAIVNDITNIDDSISDFIENKFHLTEKERISLVLGFDGETNFILEIDENFYKFGERIRNIVNPVNFSRNELT